MLMGDNWIKTIVRVVTPNAISLSLIHILYVPKTEQYFTTSLAIVPLQLMGYYVSVAKGLDVDKPRNLAKSVTVE